MASKTTLNAKSLEALVANDYGQLDGLIEIMAPVLGRAGLEHLKVRIIDLSNRPVPRPADKDRVKIGWGSGGPIYADEMEESSRRSTVRLALMDIAEHGKPSSWNWPDFDWEDTRIAVLDALGRADDAQAVRWDCFQRSLSIPHLRDYLKRLPDFDDVEAEEKALDYAQNINDLTQALYFLTAWPALDRAAALVLRRAGELDGDQYEILPRAADALAAKYPLAATLLLRALIDFTLSKARSSRYKHAARHLEECASLAAAVSDFGAFEPHDVYVARLRREYGRKESLWSLIGNTRL